MSTHEVKVVPITLEKHPNADTLSIVRVGGYTCVVKTSSFDNYDRGAYIPPDSIITESMAAQYTGGKTRIKAVKIRGIVSQGLLIPIQSDIPIGTDLMSALEVKHYEPSLEVSTYGPVVKGPSVGAPNYTDIENQRRLNSLLIEGEEVVITEKIHGCLKYNTNIKMADGTYKHISYLVKNNCVGEYVLGEIDGELVESKILNVFKNESTDSWLKIKTTRANAGRGNAFCALHCTTNHKILTKFGYLPAEKLNIGDTVYSTRTDLQLTEIQKQVLLGLMLGDGSLAISGSSAHVSFSHSENQIEYIDWIIRALTNICFDKKEQYISGFGSTCYRSRTKNLVFIKDFLKDFIVAGTKIVPDWVADEIGPIAIAFWYMDDGSLAHEDGQEDRANFAVCSFTQKDCFILQKGLEKFGIKSEYYISSGYSRLRINSDFADKLFLLIAPYIPPSMQYKLPERYRGHIGWIPAKNATYKKHIVEQKVLEIIPYVQNQIRYDLETETHNFFASDILVHNSNARYVYWDGELHCGSRTQWKERTERSIWWLAAEKAGIEEKIKSVPGLVVYGEVFGNVQDLKYGHDKSEAPSFLAFDMYWCGKYLNYDNFVFECNARGIKRVPELYRGPWKPSLVDELSNGKSTVSGADNIREGFVVKPVIERWDERCGRVVLKVIGNDYLLRS